MKLDWSVKYGYTDVIGTTFTEIEPRGNVIKLSFRKKFPHTKLAVFFELEAYFFWLNYALTQLKLQLTVTYMYANTQSAKKILLK